MANSPKLAVVAGDRGGWNAIAPVLDVALENGCEVSVFLTATCAKQHAVGALILKEQIAVYAGEADAALKEFMVLPHDVLIICASQSAEGSAVAAAAADMTGAPVLAQDTYGSLVPTLRMTDAPERFRSICVTDSFARDELIRKVNDLLMDFGDVVITGGPQFDHVAEIRHTWQERRTELREAMRLAEDDLLFLVPGQLNGTAEALAVIEDAIWKLEEAHRAYIVCRFHPRQTPLDKHLVLRQMDGMARHLLKYVCAALAPNSEALLPAADFVVSGYSTTNYVGILYQMPGVVYLGTPSFCHDLGREKGRDKPIEVELGAGWYVQHVEDMMHVIEEVQKGDQSTELQRIRAAQATIAAKNDGQATQRVWAEIERLLAG